ncbi:MULTISPECIES: diaminopimelate decarboxylase [unclassified Mycolicibacterium]|uniref:diaminopimelate decarboxylase n=1 Tax=unclassified Mycolicibacterium TaxID=2636767 RepID=UPI001309318C|nr:MULTISPECIES: diaminopimelate decarboxylase [unclassified Mycolicibacterium]MUL84191.1 diaminopimelate decarboxylase [Mycolicibacterium sp. CBMA 329]MUL89743.1 diaminopimelate decarboxylase [Mycolicibacterium sp. CBMA 331]MUL99918.1 diaminopimelate decarboxylase [Mycolicibacterium sp. CBMA 334]MUM27071.1 diaminopimelate decarboxylase [Mycolicibacterium sp. CBMA 295]MUM39258.1 diaminopimelate decarboxylase [Mycolicibacterium sp. CBMA 247]
MIDVPPRTRHYLPTPDTLLRRRGQVVAGVVRHGFIDDLHPLCGVIDLDTLDELMRSLNQAYPTSMPALHTIAAKAITLRPVLARFAQAGFGCEVASPGELELALATGFSAERIVFDSPAKTTTEIERALELGISFNVDNFEELARVDQAIARMGGRRSVIGMRLNPQTGAGAIGAMSTATTTSKFGIGLADYREAIIDAFAVRPWLTQLHVHSGSQGLRLEHAAAGVRLIAELAGEITARVGHRQIQRIDIGGGLPVNFDSDDITPTFADHRAALEAAAPELFDGTYTLVTEFGRALTAKAGTIVARVEYTKVTGGRPIAITHAGVQLATRTIFAPEEWPLRIEVYDPQGRRRDERPQVQDVAGPACFTGDMLAVGRELPFVHPGDLVAVPETGGYYFSTHFSYNALPRPAVYAVETDPAGGRRWSLARRAQTIEQIVTEAGEPSLVYLPVRPSD